MFDKVMDYIDNNVINTNFEYSVDKKSLIDFIKSIETDDELAEMFVAMYAQLNSAKIELN